MQTTIDLPSGSYSLADNAVLRRFCWLASIGVVIQAGLLISATWAPDSRLTVVCMYSLPLIPLLVAVSAVRVARLSSTPVRPASLLIGWGLIVGGAGFDLFSTLWHSPELTEEGNLPLRILLDSQHSLVFVYGYGLLVNLLFTGLFCILWWAVLKHCDLVSSAVRHQGPESLFEFLKAATGGGHLTLRQWLWPLRLSEMPLLYFWIWPTVLTVVWSATMLRWYAGLEWFEVIPPTLIGRAIVMALAGTAVLVMYFRSIREAVFRDSALPLDMTSQS